MFPHSEGQLAQGEEAGGCGAWLGPVSCITGGCGERVGQLLAHCKGTWMRSLHSGHTRLPGPGWPARPTLQDYGFPLWGGRASFHRMVEGRIPKSVLSTAEGNKKLQKPEHFSYS